MAEAKRCWRRWPGEPPCSLAAWRGGLCEACTPGLTRARGSGWLDAVIARPLEVPLHCAACAPSRGVRLWVSGIARSPPREREVALGHLRMLRMPRQNRCTRPVHSPNLESCCKAGSLGFPSGRTEDQFLLGENSLSQLRGRVVQLQNHPSSIPSECEHGKPSEPGGCGRADGLS